MSASQQAQRYPVGSVQWPYFHREGAIAGLPVVAIRFDRASKVRLTAHDLIREVQSSIPPETHPRPRWMAIFGGDGIANNELLVCLRTRLGLLSFFETSGEQSMTDSDEQGGRLPLYDHVCVRVSLPVRTIKSELWHSVVVQMPKALDHLINFSSYLDKAAFNGHRYISAPAEQVARAKDFSTRLCHSSWRVLGAA